MGGSQQDGYPSFLPPPSGGSKVAGLCSPPRGDPPKWPARTRHLSRDQGRGKRGTTRHFSIYSLIKGYFKKPISHNISAKLALSLLKCQNLPISFLRVVRRKNVSYIVTRAYKRPAKTTHHAQSATLQSTSLQKAVNNKNKAGHNSTRGIVSS